MIFFESYDSSLIKLRQFNACVVVLQNLVVGEAGARHAVGSHLAETYAVTPAASREGEAYDATRFVVAAVYDKELFA